MYTLTLFIKGQSPKTFKRSLIELLSIIANSIDGKTYTFDITLNKQPILSGTNTKG